MQHDGNNNRQAAAVPTQLSRLETAIKYVASAQGVCDDLVDRRRQLKHLEAACEKDNTASPDLKKRLTALVRAAKEALQDQPADRAGEKLRDVELALVQLQREERDDACTAAVKADRQRTAELAELRAAEQRAAEQRAAEQRAAEEAEERRATKQPAVERRPRVPSVVGTVQASMPAARKLQGDLLRIKPAPSPAATKPATPATPAKPPPAPAAAPAPPRALVAATAATAAEVPAEPKVPTSPNRNLDKLDQLLLAFQELRGTVNVLQQEAKARRERNNESAKRSRLKRKAAAEEEAAEDIPAAKAGRNRSQVVHSDSSGESEHHGEQRG